MEQQSTDNAQKWLEREIEELGESLAHYEEKVKSLKYLFNLKMTELEKLK